MDSTGNETVAEEISAPSRPGASAGYRWPEIATVTLFAAIVAYAIPFHEPWSDEAQAWQLARNLSLGNLFHTYIRYEAAPGLWYVVLWILARLHVGYAGLHWICGLIATSATAVLAFRSPLPRYLRLTLPFTYFLLFQYAVIARSYVLVPLLLFLIADSWKKRPMAVAILLGLLANLTLHAALISGGLAIVYLVCAMRRSDLARPSARTLASCALILAAFYGACLWTAWPPHDLASHLHGQMSHPFLISAFGSVVLGVCQPWTLSVLVWIAIAFCLGGRDALLFLLPVLLFALFSGVVFSQFWHMGMMAPLIVTVFWITWPNAADKTGRTEIAGRAALLVMAAVQILWTGYALNWDHGHAYSGDLAASGFLEPFVRANDRIVVTAVDQPDSHAFDSVGILPYFDRSIYENQPEAFWSWSERNPIEDRFNAALRLRPQIVLVEARLRHPGDTFDLNEPGFQRITRDGYRLTNEFCGTMPERLELGITTCHLIFQPVDSVSR